MEIAYCTRLIPHIPNLYEKYPNNKFILSVDRFIMNQIAGIEEATGKLVSIINLPDVPSYPRFPAIIMREQDWSHTNDCKDVDIGFLNLPIVRQLTVPYKIEKRLDSWVKRNKNKKKIVLTYSTNPMCMSALIKMKKKDNNVRIVLVVGDLIGDKGIDIKGKGVMNKLLNIYYQQGVDLIPEFDGYILLTDCMAEELGVSNKPNLVIEGIYNKNYELDNGETEEENDNTKIIFHAGSLERRFGVFNLLTAFSEIKDNSYRLWLAGGSSEQKEIEKYCNKDHRIKYYGFIPPQQVYELQKQATVIVNPRTAKGDYTKFSFPSKTMEGLASGKPFIGYKLPGIPIEYFKYIQCVEDDSPVTLSKKIIEICELPKNDRNEIGKKSREFILKEKNCLTQGKKIVRFLESL